MACLMLMMTFLLIWWTIMINLRVLQIKQSKPPLQHWQIVTKGLKYIKKQFLYTPNTEANHDRIMNEFERFFQQNYEIVKSFNIHHVMFY